MVCHPHLSEPRAVRRPLLRGMGCSPDAADNSIRYIQGLRWRVPGMTSLKYKGDEGIVTAVLRRCGVEPGGWQG
ncbi:hypothetical protein BH23ACT4_BH23ACT4_05020 [soil metagenome]